MWSSNPKHFINYEELYMNCYQGIYLFVRLIVLYFLNIKAENCRKDQKAFDHVIYVICVAIIRFAFEE